MMRPQPDFIHQLVPGNSKRTLLLLHGTGGNERDLIPLGHDLDPNASLLSPRGKVLENGMQDFFVASPRAFSIWKICKNGLTNWPTSSSQPRRTTRSTSTELSPSVIPIVPTSPRACSYFDRKFYRLRFCFALWSH